MELLRKVPSSVGHHDRGRRRLASVQAVSFALCALTSASGGEVNEGYPTEIVPLEAGLLLCLSVEQVEEAFANWRAAFEQRAPEKLARGCARIPEGYSARIEYMGSFANQHWDADLLKFLVLKPAAPGILVFDDVYYGYGSARIRPEVLQTLPRPVSQ